jgi:hypothetical protein
MIFSSARNAPKCSASSESLVWRAGVTILPSGRPFDMPETVSTISEVTELMARGTSLHWSHSWLNIERFELASIHLAFQLITQ